MTALNTGICAVGWPIYSDVSVLYAPALSGGSFQSALPLVNVQDKRLAKVARTTDALSTSTTFDVDLGVARMVGVLAVLIPNLTKSSTPTIQWKGGTSLGASDVYDSGAVQAWPTGVTAEDVTGADGSAMNVWLTTLPTTTQTARYWRCAVVDTGNSDGYLNFARVAICGIFQPSINMSWGAKSGHETATTRTETDGGAAVFVEKPRRRTDTFTIEYATQTEAMANIRKIIRQLGTSRQLFWVPDPSDTTYMWERAFLGVLKSLSLLDFPIYNRMTAAFEVTEEL